MSVQALGLSPSTSDLWRRIRKGRGTVARRVGWGLADQALSSLTNFALVVAVAHQSSARQFGVFALAFASFSVALGCCRAVCSEPLAVRFSHAASEAFREGASLATGGALIAGALGGLACLAAGALIGGQALPMFAILGVCLPGLLLQDTWRYSFFAERRGAAAFANDGVYALLLLPAVAVAVLVGDGGPQLLLGMWGSAALLAALLGVKQAGLVPRPTRIAVWWRAQSDLAPRYLAEFVAVTGDSQLVLYGVAALAGLGAVAALRGGLLLLGPLNILVFGAMLSAVPEVVRLLRRAPHRLTAAVVSIAAALLALTALWAGALLALPTNVGHALLGPTWHSARAVLLPLSVSAASLGLVVAAVVGLRALTAVRRSLRARLTVSPIIFTSALLGSISDGAAGAAWGLAIGQTVAAVVFWYHLVRAAREHGLRRHAAPATPMPLTVSDAAQPS